MGKNDKKLIREMINEARIHSNVIEESSLSRVWQHIEEGERSFGIVSTFRGDRSLEENLELYAKLKERVRDMGLGYIELDGGYKEEGGWVKEKSLFIPKIDKQDLMDLGIEHDQYSVIYKDDDEFVEIGTNDNAGIGDIKRNFIKSGWDENLTINSPETKEFFSSLVKGSHRGEKFLFNMDEAYLYEKIPLSFNEVAYGRKKPGVDETKIRLL